MEHIVNELVNELCKIGAKNVLELNALIQGCFYELDGQMCIDYTKAFDAMSKAAEYDIEYNQMILAHMYEYGIGTEENMKEAVKWYRKLAEAGNTDAMVSLGDCYFDGNGVEQDYITANSYYLKAANAGDVMGMSSIADSYYWGKGLEANQSIAAEWYRKAAELGDVYSEWSAAHINWRNEKYEEAAKGFIKVIEGEGDKYKTDSKYMLGVCYYLGKGVAQNYCTAVDLFTEIAQEESAAAFFLGECYRLGQGVEQNDYKAFQNMLFCAQNENGEMGLRAQQYVAECYRMGRGVEKDEGEAVKWERKVKVIE